jgi:hypothetical protein
MQRRPSINARGTFLPARVGGALTLLASVGIFASLLIRPSASPTLVNISILLVASVGGLLSVIWPERFGAVLAATFLLLAAIYPLLWSGLGLLFLPSLILLIAGARQARSRTQ